ncbi:MAG: nuclear transport factor 2 family protein, partial [Gammaproteobacteria bacterium]|nr:nuclear transport factor 2 family protein [Gammaproteobacteria bacterium]
MPEFTTPHDAEASFYQAFEDTDLDAMMAVWLDTDTVTCIHPLGPALRGRTQVRDGWRQIFNGRTKMRFR